MSYCPFCKRPLWNGYSGYEPGATCTSKGGEACELFCQLTEAREKLAALLPPDEQREMLIQLRQANIEVDRLRERLGAAERVIEAAVVLSNGEGSPCDMAHEFNSALRAYQDLKRPDKEE